MLDALLPGIARLGYRDRLRNVSRKRNPEVFGFVSNGEEGVTRESRIDLYEISAILSGLPYRLASLRFICDGHGFTPDRVRTVYYVAGYNQTWAEQAAGFLLFSPMVMHRHTPHLPYAGHSVGKKKRKIIFEIPVNVHIPKSWYQKLTFAGDDLSIFRCADASGRSNFSNSITGDHYGHIRGSGRTGDVDYSDVCNYQLLCCYILRRVTLREH